MGHLISRLKNDWHEVLMEQFLGLEFIQVTGSQPWYFSNFFCYIFKLLCLIFATKIHLDIQKCSVQIFSICNKVVNYISKNWPLTVQSRVNGDFKGETEKCFFNNINKKRS